MAAENQRKHLQALAPAPGYNVSHPRVSAVAKLRKNSTACLPCRQAKRKCTGYPTPCQPCQKTNAECIFDETLDLRRKVAARRTQVEMQYYRTLLYSLLEALGSSEKGQSRRTLEALRRCSSLDDIVAVVDKPITNCSDTELQDIGKRLKDTIDGNRYPSPSGCFRIKVERLCDTPPFELMSKPWTEMTDDNHLVSHLVSLYFTWDHPLSHIVDQRTFLAHMGVCNIDSEFCSPVLVNSILAIGSTFSCYPEVFATPGGSTSKGKVFFNEAERLWRAEDGQISLTNIQAVSLMSHFLWLGGKQEASWLMIRQAVQLAQDCDMFQYPRSRHTVWERWSVDMQRVAGMTAWGIFAANSQISMELGKVANLARPRREAFPNDNLDNIMWTPYPLANQMEHTGKPAFLRSVMVKLAGLTDIIVDIQELLFDKALDVEVKTLWEIARQLYTRMKGWLQRLPDYLHITKEPLPHILFLHLRYQHAITSLVGFFLGSEAYEKVLLSSILEEARITQLHSAKQIANCVQILQGSYGLKYVQKQILEPVNRSTLAVLVAFKHEGSEDTFVQLHQFLMALQNRHAQSQSMLQDIRETANRLKIVLPCEAFMTVAHRRSGQPDENRIC